MLPKALLHHLDHCILLLCRHLIVTGQTQPPMEKIPCFYGRGVWDESVMGFRDRVLVKLLKKMTAKQDPAGYEPWQAALMSAPRRRRTVAFTPKSVSSV